MQHPADDALLRSCAFIGTSRLAALRVRQIFMAHFVRRSCFRNRLLGVGGSLPVTLRGLIVIEAKNREREQRRRLYNLPNPEWKVIGLFYFFPFYLKSIKSLHCSTGFSSFQLCLIKFIFLPFFFSSQTLLNCKVL